MGIVQRQMRALAVNMMQLAERIENSPPDIDVAPVSKLLQDRAAAMLLPIISKELPSNDGQTFISVPMPPNDPNYGRLKDSLHILKKLAEKKDSPEAAIKDLRGCANKLSDAIPISKAEFSRLSGLSKGRVTQLASAGIQITLGEARRRMDQAGAVNRSKAQKADRTESDEEVERLFRKLAPQAKV